MELEQLIEEFLMHLRMKDSSEATITVLFKADAKVVHATKYFS